MELSLPSINPSTDFLLSLELKPLLPLTYKTFHVVISSDTFLDFSHTLSPCSFQCPEILILELPSCFQPQKFCPCCSLHPEDSFFFFKQTNKQIGYQFSLTRFLIIIFGHTTHMRNIPDPGPMQWKLGVLNTGPPGKFLPRTLFQVFYLFKSWFRYHFSEKLLLVLPCRPVLLGIIYPVFLCLFLFLTMLITLWRGPICFYPFIS